MKKFTTQIVTGHGRGRYLGYPTINMKIPAEIDLEFGIYAGFVWLEGTKYYGAFHYGSVPTFDQQVPSLEVFVLDTTLDIIPDLIEFELIKKLREIIKFDSSEDLVSQIKVDIVKARNLLSEYDNTHE